MILKKNADIKHVRTALKRKDIVVSQQISDHKYVIYKKQTPMNKKKIPLATIAQRLEKAIHADVGMRGLYILLYGWQQQRIRRGIGTITLRARTYDSGEAFLFAAELQDFSDYAGYDLTKN